MQLAVTQGHTDLVQLLVAEGADVNMEDEDGDTAMHVALLRPQLASIMLSPVVGTSSTEDSSEGCSSTSLYCRVRGARKAKIKILILFLPPGDTMTFIYSIFWTYINIRLFTLVLIGRC